MNSISQVLASKMQTGKLCVSAEGLLIGVQELGNIAWCPVLSQAPTAGLPWPSSSERLAPPRGTRPLSDAWLCSSTLRLLSTECRHVTPIPEGSRTGSTGSDHAPKHDTTAQACTCELLTVCPMDGP